MRELVDSFSNIIILSHHPKSHTKGVCATINNVFFSGQFLKHDPVYYNTTVYNDYSSCHINPDSTVIANGLFSVLNENGFQALRHATNVGAYIILYVHENAMNMSRARRFAPFYNLLITLSRKKQLHFWAVSAKTKQLLMLDFYASFEDISVVWEAVNLPESTLIRNRPPVSFVGAGHLNDDRKGLDYFIALSEDISSCLPNALFTWYWDVAKEDVEQAYGKPVNVRFPGFVSDLPAALQQHDAFILTSRDDPCPIVAIEALGIDMPVFCFDVTGTAEFVPPEFIATDYPEMLDNIKNYMRMSKKYPKGFFRNIAAQFTPEKFWERIIKPISAKTVRPIEIKKPNIRTLRRHYLNGKEAERLLMTDKSGKDPKTDMLIKLLEQWPADRANFPPQTITDFERMVERMLPGCDPACKQFWNMLNTVKIEKLLVDRVLECLTSSKKTYHRVVVAGLGKNGKRLLDGLKRKCLPAQIKLFGWDDALTDNEIIAMGLTPFCPIANNNILDGSLVVITPLVPNDIIKPLFALDVDWAHDVIMSDERFDSEFSRL